MVVGPIILGIYDPGSRKWTYHVVVPRKAMVHPGKTPGCLGDPPDPWKLSSVRVSHVQYKDKTPVTIYEDSYAFGKNAAYAAVDRFG